MIPDFGWVFYYLNRPLSVSFQNPATVNLQGVCSLNHLGLSDDWRFLPPVAPIPGVPSIRAEYFLYSFGDRNVSMNPNKIIISLKLNSRERKELSRFKKANTMIAACVCIYSANSYSQIDGAFISSVDRITDVTLTGLKEGHSF